MYKVKFTFPYPEWPVLRQTPNSLGIWGDYQFFLNDKTITECDFWLIFEGVSIDETVKCDKRNIIFIGGEGSSTGFYSKAFLNQFGRVITCQDRIEHPNKSLYHTANPWFVGKTYDELISTNYVPKIKNLSLICSDKQSTDGHKKRYDFCMKMKEFFGDDIDLFGRGIKDFDDKWEVLADYKYSIAIENYVEPNWFTEKIYDCFLAHTIPFYYGCPNIDDYFSNDSYIKINLEDFEYSKKVIENTLNNSSKYEIMLPKVLESKMKYLDHYNLFPLIAGFAGKQNLKIKLTSNTVYKTPRGNFKNRLSNLFINVYEKINKANCF